MFKRTLKPFLTRRDLSPAIPQYLRADSLRLLWTRHNCTIVPYPILVQYFFSRSCLIRLYVIFGPRFRFPLKVNTPVRRRASAPIRFSFAKASMSLPIFGNLRSVLFTDFGTFRFSRAFLSNFLSDHPFLQPSKSSLLLLYLFLKCLTL